MKAPRFEAIQRRWQGKAEVFYVYSREAHPRAAQSARLNAFADELARRDRDGDRVVTRVEYAGLGPRWMFDAFDLDHDGAVHAHELLAARRIDQFKGFEKPSTYAQRVAAATRFRGEIAGDIPVLVDEMDDRVGRAYGGLPNSAFVIAADGRVTRKWAWADASAVDAELARLVDGRPTVRAGSPAPDWSLLDAARAAAADTSRPLLVQLTAPGCGACDTMRATTLQHPSVKSALRAVHVVTLSVANDSAWALFESLGFHGTPAFALVGPDGTVRARAEGVHDVPRFLAFLRMR